MDMESIKNTFDKKLEELKTRGEAQKGIEYRYLWVRVSYAVVKDEHIKKIGARAFGVFVVIRAFMGQDETAYPALKTIAYLSGVGVSTIQNEVETLIKNGWIKKIGRVKKDDGTFGNTIYRILQTDLIRGSKQKGFIDNPVVQSNNGD